MSVAVCPLCDSPLLHAIRVRQNEHVVYCPNLGTHGYIEGSGETVEDACEAIRKKSKAKQENLFV